MGDRKGDYGVNNVGTTEMCVHCCDLYKKNCKIRLAALVKDISSILFISHTGHASEVANTVEHK